MPLLLKIAIKSLICHGADFLLVDMLTNRTLAWSKSEYMQTMRNMLNSLSSKEYLGTWLYERLHKVNGGKLQGMVIV